MGFHQVSIMKLMLFFLGCKSCQKRFEVTASALKKKAVVISETFATCRHSKARSISSFMKLSTERQSQPLLQNLRQRRFQYKNDKANHGIKEEKNEGLYVNRPAAAAAAAAAGIAEDVLVCAWRSGVLRRLERGWTFCLLSLSDPHTFSILVSPLLLDISHSNGRHWS